MSVDRKKLEQAMNVPDAQFAQLVYTVVTAAGGGKMRAAAAAANAGKLKKKLLEADDEELAQLSKAIDPKMLSEILDALGRNG